MVETPPAISLTCRSYTTKYKKDIVYSILDFELEMPSVIFFNERKAKMDKKFNFSIFIFNFSRLNFHFAGFYSFTILFA